MGEKQDESKIREKRTAVLALVRENLEEFKAMGKVPKQIFRTEVLDRDTCPVCRARNGTSWKSVDEIDRIPGDDCEAGTGCRGGYTADFIGPE